MTAAEGRVALGAEAEVCHAEYLGRAVLEKRRLPKAYRHPRLDHSLRALRTRDEASLLIAARAAGVAVPLVYDVDRGASTLRLEPLVGPTLRQALGDISEAPLRRALLLALGRLVARLHNAGLTHGDLTPGNVLVTDVPSPRLALIDFGLGAATLEAEPQGVDLHLLEEALEATEADAPALFAAFLESYAREAARAGEALARLEGIRRRGRNR